MGISLRSKKARLVLTIHQSAKEYFLRKGQDINPVLESFRFLRSRIVINKGATGSTALIWAARGGDEAVVRFLLAKGADIKIIDDEQLTTIAWALREEHEGIVKMLQAKGADLKDREGRAALLHAPYAGQYTVVRFLLSERAEVKTLQNDIGQALLSAAQAGRETVISLLLAQERRLR